MLVRVLDDLGEDFASDVGKRDAVIGAIVLDHVADGLRLESNDLVDFKRLAIGALESNLLGGGHGFGFGLAEKLMVIFVKKRTKKKSWRTLGLQEPVYIDSCHRASRCPAVILIHFLFLFLIIRFLTPLHLNLYLFNLPILKNILESWIFIKYKIENSQIFNLNQPITLIIIPMY